MNRFNTIGLLILLLALSSAKSQQLHDFGFSIDSLSIEVFDSSAVPYSYPFFGGMNAMQFGLIDCNLDGKKDLVAFDVHGQRLSVLLKTDAGWVFAPQYSYNFPPLQGFMQLVDFNQDGKEDIFTYNGAGGIKVYKNTSDSALSFSLYTDQIASVYDEIPVNLFCTEGDYVVIKDLDGDGDLDILSFWALGKYIDFHRNLSIERFGHADSLVFQAENRCWGHFSESGEDNEIFLNDDCNLQASTAEKAKRHTGSSMLAFDADADGFIDLLLGDIGYPKMVLLTNGGTNDSVYFVDTTTNFPDSTSSVNLFSMPCANLLNISSDTVKDLLVSPFDLSFTKSENHQSVWWYKNWGNDLQPDFRLQTKSFLQEQMLDFGSGAYPVFYDLNNDGLLDILVGNYGYFDSGSVDIYGTTTCSYSSSLALLINIGTKIKPKFQLQTIDFLNLRQQHLLGLSPAVGDINGDGFPDILLACYDGTVLYFQADSFLSFQPAVANFQSIQLGMAANIQLFDFDEDGLLDLMVGKRDGKVAYYRNTGTVTNPNFILSTDTLGNIDVRDYDLSYYGYANVNFHRDSTHGTVIFVGSESGKISYYKVFDAGNGWIEREIEQLFVVKSQMPFAINEGMRTAPAVADINGDGFLDLLVGNFAGGLAFYPGTVPPNREISVTEDAIHPTLLEYFPNPCSSVLSLRSFEEMESVKVISLLGIISKQLRINGLEVDIDISDLSKGVYVVQVQLKSNRSQAFKLIKM